jgi:hypothetical protein
MSFIRLLSYNMILDTMFYLPNRFRYTVMGNWLKMDFATSETALLTSMKSMFNLEG